MCNAPLELDDELWLYYTEANGAHPISPFPSSVSQIRAAVWRKDGFASLQAADTGVALTRPLAWQGNRLILNVKTEEQGSVRVALLDAAENPLPGFGLGDCDPVRGDQNRAVVSWGGKPDLSAFQGQTVRLRIELSRGTLYSFRAARE